MSLGITLDDSEGQIDLRFFLGQAGKMLLQVEAVLIVILIF